MERRQFLARGLGLGALACAPGAALADAQTYKQFHAALARDPSLALYADTVGAQSGQASVQGKLPLDLNGVFYRNGPGRFELGGERYHHWFDGDGFAQRWQIGAGQVSHIGRFVATPKFKAESQAGQFLYPAFGTRIERAAVKNSDSVNAANTNLVPLGGRVYALWEGGSATELDPATLATLGPKNWRADLQAMPFSAHPKIDPDGGLWNFGALSGGDQMAIYQLGANASLLRFGAVAIPDLAMVHDFAVSAKHLIFLIAPFDVRPDPQASYLDMHHWAGSGPAGRALRAVVVAKDSLQVRAVFELPARMVFHFGNAYDDGSTTRLDVVMHEGDVLHALGAPMRGEHAPSTPGSSYASQITLDYASGTAREARLFGDCEFPRVMPQVVARRHRKLALLGSAGAQGTLDSVHLVDTDSGKADSYSFGPGWQVEEHVLVPRRGARNETDGYLLGVAQDSLRGRTVLSVFDAAHISTGPIALAALPYRAPLCFHGNFLAA
ncbi:MAG: carotenoid oxygenase family protein [Pseudomonadota bacterium]